MIPNYLRDILVREKTDSPSLRLEKYVILGDIKEYKSREIDSVIGAYKKGTRNTDLLFRHPAAENVRLRLRGRLVINQAGGALENSGLCLHRFLGIPYIPGSAVKGVTRHYAWEKWNEAPEEEKLVLAEKIAKNFGFPTEDPKGESKLDDYLRKKKPDEYTQETVFSGAVSFLGGVPEDFPRLVKDIVTPHHLKYYAEDANYLNQYNGLAQDNEPPIPNPFLAVESGTRFVFQLLLLKSTEGDLAWCKDMLVHALRYNGIGSKTSAGYGWFDDGKTKAEIEKEGLEAKKQEREEAAKKRDEEETRIQHEIAERIRLQNEEEAKAKKEKLSSKGFEGFEDIGWSSMQKKIEKILKAGIVFSEEQKSELEQIISDNSKIQAKDIEKSRNSFKRYFGDEGETFDRIMARKGGQA